jgi:hypothetical protein
MTLSRDLVANTAVGAAIANAFFIVMIGVFWAAWKVGR